MSTKDKATRATTTEASELPDVRHEQIEFQLLQGIARIESRLDAIEGRLTGSGRKGGEKPKLRNEIISMLQKGWLSEEEAMVKTGWQTVGVRSFVTKLRTLGLVVETEDRNGVPHYRIAK